MTPQHPAITSTMRRAHDVADAVDIFGADPRDKDHYPYMLGYCNGSRAEAVRIADECWADLVCERRRAGTLAARVELLSKLLTQHGIAVPQF